jgi:hypothetical protein
MKETYDLLPAGSRFVVQRLQIQCRFPLQGSCLRQIHLQRAGSVDQMHPCPCWVDQILRWDWQRQKLLHRIQQVYWHWCWLWRLWEAVLASDKLTKKYMYRMHQMHYWLLVVRIQQSRLGWSGWSVRNRHQNQSRWSQPEPLEINVNIFRIQYQCITYRTLQMVWQHSYSPQIPC